MRCSRLPATICVFLISLGLLAAPQSTLAQAGAKAGDDLPRIQCPPGYTAQVYAQGLVSLDGLAISPDGIVHVAEERVGRVTRISAAGGVTPVLTGLDHPEGIAFDPQTGELYVVEDREHGRLIARAADGTVSTLAGDLEAPEGIAWTEGALYLTESTLEYAQPLDLRTRVSAFSSPVGLTPVITNTPVLSGTQVHVWSYAGIAAGPDDRLYVTNELSGYEETHAIVVIPDILTVTLTLTTSDSIFAIDPRAGTRELVASGLTAPEGLRFSSDGGYPLFVAEEDAGSGRGRITAIQADGGHAPFCTGFMTIEDVVVDEQGNLYVSEDSSGMVIRIEREQPRPDAPHADFTGAPRAGFAPLTVAFRDTSTGVYQTRQWYLGDGQASALENPVHTYQVPGAYEVTLTVTGTEGSDSRIKDGYIVVSWGGYLPLVFRPR
jgi:glucose/arabinose dehydrogenase